MAVQQTVICDGCGQVKGSGNHWFFIFMEDDNEFVIAKWGEPKESCEKHVCSDQCAVKFLQQWLSSQKESAA